MKLGKYIFIILLLLPNLLFAIDKPIVKAHIEPDSILIGSRFFVVIDVEKDQVQTVLFPTFETKIGGTEDSPVENIKEYPEDTISQSGRKLYLRKRYELVAYDEGNYSLGKAQVLYADKNIVDTLYSEDSLRLHVATFALDSVAMAKGICDIKPQKNLPFRFGEISGYILDVILIIALILVILFAIDRYMQTRGKRITDIFKPAPPLPAHVVAIEALEKLHNQKLWQNNHYKEYYSRLSEILRTYLSGQFEVGAMEMTTDEIVKAITPLNLPQKSAMDLITVLRDSDLVKFAKAMPEAAENEYAYTKAYYFVEETKPQIEVATDEDDIPTTNPKN